MPYEHRRCYCPHCKCDHFDTVAANYDSLVSRKKYGYKLNKDRPVIECDACMERRIGKTAFERYKKLMSSIMD